MFVIKMLKTSLIICASAKYWFFNSYYIIRMFSIANMFVVIRQDITLLLKALVFTLEC